MSERTPNVQQQSVIDELDRNLILFASAGTGKTFSVACRVANILRQRRAEPEAILCLTFTVKACGEMLQDILTYAGEEGKRVAVRTIHGFCYQVIREQAHLMPSHLSDPQIADDVDADHLLKEALRDVGYTETTFALKGDTALTTVMSILKQEREWQGLYSSDEVQDFQAAFRSVQAREASRFSQAVRGYDPLSRGFITDRALLDFLESSAGVFAHAYCDALRKDNLLDFDDIICLAHRLFLDEAVAAMWRSRFPYVVIDEMQDTSLLEYDTLRRLFPGNHIMMCGDYFQTIYHWRGSDPDRILNEYIRDFDPVRVYYAENYRSTRKLCQASFGYLKASFPALMGAYCPDDLIIRSPVEGERIYHFGVANLQTEAWLITDFLLKRPPKDPARVCLMARSNYRIARLYEALKSQRAVQPNDLRFFTVDEDRRFSRKAVIKNILAFPRVLLSQRTDEYQLTRILRSAAFGIGDRTLERLRELRPLGLTPASFVSHDAQTHMDPYASLICAAQEGNLVIYDTETTGLDVLRDDIIQLSAIRMNAEGEILDTFDELLIPTVPMSSGALMTHHKTMDEILAGGLEAREGLRRFSAFVDGCVLVGHNSLRFDRPLVRSQMRKRGLPLPSDAGEYDTMLIAKQFLPALRNYRLETLCREFGIVNEHAHDALGDITATGRVLVRLLHDFILPATEARRNAVAAYAPKFAALYAFLNELDGNYLRVGDIQGLLHAVMDVLHLPSRCVRDSDRDAIRDLTDYFSPYDGSRPELDAEGELRDFLANLALSGSQMDVLIHKLHKIPIITVHQAKGCEFDTVIIVDADEGSYPSGRSRTPEEEAEEQRIFYVAISRAREQLILISTQDRYGSYHMSPYIDRIPSSCIARWEWPGHERVD